MYYSNPPSKPTRPHHVLKSQKVIGSLYKSLIRPKISTVVLPSASCQCSRLMTLDDTSYGMISKRLPSRDLCQIWSIGRTVIPREAVLFNGSFGAYYAWPSTVSGGLAVLRLRIHHMIKEHVRSCKKHERWHSKSPSSI